MVAGFAASAPNATLLALAGDIRRDLARPRALDIGCGAGRHAIPLAQSGWDVVAVDRSMAMLLAAHPRAAREQVAARTQFVQAEMHRLPAADRRFDLLIAHGIWNLAQAAAEFRQGLEEAARAAAPRARLFIFTFSRTTLPPGAEPVPGEPYVFTGFAGRPQTFLTEGQLLDELARAGFLPDPRHPLHELNKPLPGALPALAPAPVIWEGLFRRDD